MHINPQYVVDQVPKSINKRLTTISKNESFFNRAKQNYQKALVKGDYTPHYLKYNAGNDKKTKMKNVLYFKFNVLFDGRNKDQ